MPLLTGNPVTRTVLLYQLSARPRALPADLALQQMRSFAECTSFDEVQHDLVHGPRQGSTAPGTSRTGTDQRRPMCLILVPTG
jgi:hypothetical protein